MAEAKAAGTRTVTLLKDGMVVDGTGAPGWPGDVLLQGDRIVAMGDGRWAMGLPIACRPVSKRVMSMSSTAAANLSRRA